MTVHDGKAVYKAIAAVQKELAKQGISKSRENKQQGYQFRGIDEVLNALAPLLAQENLCILPDVLERVVQERQTKNGNSLFSVTVRARFAFVSAEDGSSHDVVTYGEAMDTADKATNKAMSAAYKYAVILGFCIPTEGDNDADASTHEVAAKSYFADDNARQSFRIAMIASLQVERTIEGVNKVIAENQGKAEEIRKIGNLSDISVLDEIRKEYQIMLTRLKEQKPTQNVDQAVGDVNVGK